MILDKEVEAQRKRVQALAYLEAQGQNIQSNFDLVGGRDKNKSQGDNTLELLFRTKITSSSSSSSSLKSIEALSKSAILDQQNTLQSREIKIVSSETEDIPSEWERVIDKSTEKPYYWNRSTNVTTWEKPTKQVINQPVLDEDDEWVSQIHPASKQQYWLNKSTGAKCFDKLKPKMVKTTASSSCALKRGNIEQVSACSSSVKAKKFRSDVDPLDFTEGKGLYGGPADGKMADRYKIYCCWTFVNYVIPIL